MIFDACISIVDLVLCDDLVEWLSKFDFLKFFVSLKNQLLFFISYFSMLITCKLICKAVMRS